MVNYTSKKQDCVHWPMTAKHWCRKQFVHTEPCVLFIYFMVKYTSKIVYIGIRMQNIGCRQQFVHTEPSF